MKKLSSHIGAFFLSLLALLPLRILYLKANFLYVFTFYIFSYRKKVVFENIRNSFPEKPDEEINLIAKKFYRHLCDLLVESIKLKTISTEKLKKRMVVTNPELANHYFDQGKSVIVLTMHFNNWEWQSILQEYLRHKCLMVYNPARNPILDDYINKMRKRFGIHLVSTKEILKTVLTAQKENELTLTWLCADQRPKRNTRFWTTFLNQEAGFFPGPENLARHTNQVVLYQHIEKLDRGKYETSFEVLCENPEDLPQNRILELYVEKIESIIKNKPEFYLWSHKRWKHKKTRKRTKTPSMDTIKKFIKDNQLALLLIVAYLLLLAPYSLNYIFYMPDERHYVDAAIHMLKHGNYLSPINPDGGYRFLKPIFTYWMVLVSYFIFGINEFSSRLPFLLTAGMVLWLTYKTTLLAFKQKETALLALMIVGATPVLHRSTPLSLTDLPLLVFLQVMIWGIVGLLVSSTRKNSYYWALYIGAGMAVMTKGLPAVAFLLVGLFFLLVNPWKRFNIKKILHLPSLLTGIILGGFWYVVIYLQHGTDALASFYEDQVGMRVAEKVGLIASNFMSSILVVVLIMFPFMIAGWRSIFYPNQEVKDKLSIKAILGFSALWVMAMIGMATLVSKFYYRYLVPILPVMAMVMAFYILSQQNQKGVKRLLKVTTIIAFVIFIIVNIAGVGSVFLFMGPKWYYLVFILNISFASYYFIKFYSSSLLKQSMIGYLLMAGVFFGLFFVIKPISNPGEGEQLATKLHEFKIENTDAIQFYGKTRIASRLRVETKGEFFLKNWKPFESQILPETNYVIIEDTFLDSLKLNNFKLYPASAVWGDIRIDEIYQAQNKEELLDLKLKRSEIYYLGIRKEGQNEKR